MKYFIDTEFIEGSQTKRLLSIPIGKTKPTIDLISIGIVAEDGREYYAISKDFNLKEAWNRWQHSDKDKFIIDKNGNKIQPKYYWLRDNVLYPIYLDLCDTELHEQGHYDKDDWTYKEFKRLINKYGKTNKQIAEEVKEFVYKPFYNNNSDNIEWVGNKPLDIQFYGYYADYDWVAFCWLFGKMIDLPKGFPMYCNDLMQTVDELGKKLKPQGSHLTYKEFIKRRENYPKQTNEHNALADARWIKQLYEFLKNV